VLREDNTLIPTTHFELAPSAGEDAAAKSQEYVRRHWRYAESVQNAAHTGESDGLHTLFERIHSHALSVSGMAFQDAWNVDLERLRRCCIHVITEEEKLVPFCAYYLTDAFGCRMRKSVSK
jgi:uncharacterized radical SAM superfamily Fe-S cluster-containing enzyme